MFSIRKATVLIIACFALLACGDDGGGGGGGTAGDPGPPPSVGDPCDDDCGQGLTCQGSGIFAGLCSAGCNGPAACSVLRPATVCTGNQQCALPCSVDAPCRSGAMCAEITGMMVCITAP